MFSRSAWNQPIGSDVVSWRRYRHYRRRRGLAIAWEEGLGRQAVTGKTGQLQPAIVDPLQRCRSLVSRLARQDLDSVVAQQVVQAEPGDAGGVGAHQREHGPVGELVHQPARIGLAEQRGDRPLCEVAGSEEAQQAEGTAGRLASAP
jgi:hypothetical protein